MPLPKQKIIKYQSLEEENMSKDLIDPLNTDTYDDRVIVHSGIRSTFESIPQDRWDKVFGWKFKFTIRLLRVLNEK